MRPSRGRGRLFPARQPCRSADATVAPTVPPPTYHARRRPLPLFLARVARLRGAPHAPRDRPSARGPGGHRRRHLRLGRRLPGGLGPRVSRACSDQQFSGPRRPQWPALRSRAQLGPAPRPRPGGTPLARPHRPALSLHLPPRIRRGDHRLLPRLPAPHPDPLQLPRQPRIPDRQSTHPRLLPGLQPLLRLPRHRHHRPLRRDAEAPPRNGSATLPGEGRRADRGREQLLRRGRRSRACHARQGPRHPLCRQPWPGAEPRLLHRGGCALPSGIVSANRLLRRWHGEGGSSNARQRAPGPNRVPRSGRPADDRHRDAGRPVRTRGDAP